MSWNNLPIAIDEYATTGGVVSLNASTFGALFGAADGYIHAAVSTDDELQFWKDEGRAFKAILGDTVAIWPDASDPQYLNVLLSGCNFLANCSSDSANPEFSLYNGTSLLELAFVRTLYVDESQHGRAQCGDWFSSGSADILMFSSPVLKQVIWSVGSLNATQNFVPDNAGIFDNGILYGSASFTDEIGRRIAFGLFKN